MCLVSGVFIGGALLASTGMGVLFTFVLASALWRYLDISCGCFSTSLAGKISYVTLIRAIMITLCSVVAYGGVFLLQPRSGQAARLEPESAEEMPAECAAGTASGF